MPDSFYYVIFSLVIPVLSIVFLPTVALLIGLKLTRNSKIGRVILALLFSVFTFLWSGFSFMAVAIGEISDLAKLVTLVFYIGTPLTVCIFLWSRALRYNANQNPTH